MVTPWFDIVAIAADADPGCISNEDWATTFGGGTASEYSGISDDLFSLDFLAADNHTVHCTRLNDESVTADELTGQFNTVQVHVAHLRDAYIKSPCTSGDAAVSGRLPRESYFI